MVELKNVYVIDKIENIGRYAGVGKNIAKACAFIGKAKLAELPKGRTTIDGDKVYVNHDEPTYVNRKDRKAEIHHRYFDIQIPLTNDELIGLALFNPTGTGSFDEQKDIGFYEQEVTWFTLKRGEFCLIWPGVGLHAPSVTTDVVKTGRKLVFKVLA